MSMPTEETIAKLNALNGWLKEIYDVEVNISDLLARSGIDPASIGEILKMHPAEYLDGVAYFLRNMETNTSADGRNHELMLRRYGLITGKKEDLYSISHEFGIAGERIRQLVEKRINQLKGEQFKSDFEHGLVGLVDDVLKESG